MNFCVNKTPVEAIKTPVEVSKKVHLVEQILEKFILVLMKNGTKKLGKNLISWKILIRSIIVQVIMMLVLINMVLNVQHS